MGENEGDAQSIYPLLHYEIKLRPIGSISSHRLSARAERNCLPLPANSAANLLNMLGISWGTGAALEACRPECGATASSSPWLGQRIRDRMERGKRKRDRSRATTNRESTTLCKTTIESRF
jgi:hypothetical protein